MTSGLRSNPYHCWGFAVQIIDPFQLLDLFLQVVRLFRTCVCSMCAMTMHTLSACSCVTS